MKKYIDWDKVPAEYNFASAARGSVCLWKKKPYKSKDAEMFNSGKEVLAFPHEIDCQDAIIGPLPRWDRSLCKRPSSNNNVEVAE